MVRTSAGDGTEQDTGLVSIVIAQRQILKMMVGAHTQIVGHPTARRSR